jgi:hypothetical protein
MKTNADFEILIGAIIFNRIAISAYREMIMNHTDIPSKESRTAAIEVNNPPIIPDGELSQI